MRQYIRNILTYLVALFGIVAFIGLFSDAIEMYDPLKDTWTPYNVNAYLGEKTKTGLIYKGTILPIFGFVLPLVIAIILIVESFKNSWSGYLKALNTILAIILLLCVLAVLLTKEMFLSVNNLGETANLRNGLGPKICAISSTIGAILLLFATWLPFKSDFKFIEK